MRTPAGDLSRALAGWALGHDSDDQRDERERRDTHLSARIEPDGMGTIHIRLPAVELGRIQAAVDTRVMQSTRSDPEHPNPSLGYQRAMALVELTTGADSRTGTSDDGAGRSAVIKVDTEIIVHVRGDGATMHDGTPIADSTVASMLDDSFIRMLIHDAENRPVNASVRRRHPTTRPTASPNAPTPTNSPAAAPDATPSATTPSRDEARRSRSPQENGTTTCLMNIWCYVTSRPPAPWSLSEWARPH